MSVSVQCSAGRKTTNLAGVGLEQQVPHGYATAEQAANGSARTWLLVMLIGCTLTVATACDQLKVEQTPSFEEVRALHRGGEVAVALQCYRALSEEGHVGAQNALGEMYFKGDGVPKDEAEAIRWALLAAEQGDTDLLMDFANAYSQGPALDGLNEGVPKDETEGMRLRLLAAQHGDEGAQRSISQDYFHGRGRYSAEPQRFVMAYAWLDTASAALDVSTEDRSEIVDMMSGDEIELALQRSRSYRSEYVKAAARCGDGKQVRATISETEGTTVGSRVTLMFEFDCAVPQPGATGRFMKRTATGTSSTSVVMDGTTTIQGPSLGDLLGGLMRSSMRQMAMAIVPYEVVSADGDKVVVRLTGREAPGIGSAMGASVALPDPGSEVILTLDMGDGPEDGPEVVAGEAVDAETGTITLALDGEPPQLDFTRGADAVSFNILGHTMEGLLRYDADNGLVGGVAQRWEISDTTATFWLRPEARWSNGEPVTAHDFVFAWRKVLDPRNASEYAFLFYGLKNAEAVNRGELPLESLGANALDEKTLEVHLQRPVPYFDKLVAFATYNPINEAFYESRLGRYGADAEDLLYNGPFKIARWVHGASIRLEKNPQYWNAGRIRLNAIDYAYFTTDPSAIINLFQDNKTAVAALVAENLDDALQRGWKINRFSDGTVFFMEFNHREDRLTRNYHLRRAIQAVNDSPELVYRVIKLPWNLPGASLFPVWLKGVDGYFRQEYPLADPPPDDELGRRHLATAMNELGLPEPPTLVMLTGDSPSATKQAEYYQNLYKQTLGIDIRIDARKFMQRLAKMAAGDFDIVMAGWGPDYDDPMTFADRFASWNENNRGRFASAELDAAVDVARSSADPKTRMDAMARVQRILFDEAAIVVNYERGSAYVSHPRLKGIVRRAVGTDPDYTGAWIE